MRILLVVAIAACGGGGAQPREERTPAVPVAGAEPVRVELAWLVSAAPTEVKEVECKLVLHVLWPKGGDKMHEVGVWWRAQQAMIELVDVNSASGPVLFRTRAEFGAEGDLTKAPEFEVVREKDGALVVRGKDEDTPWRQIERVEIPAATPVEAQRPQG